MRLRTKTLLSVFLAGLSLATPFPVQAQTRAAVHGSAPVRFSYADLQRLRRVVDVEMSPDGEHIAYMVSAVDARMDRSTESLWVLPSQGRKAGPTEVPGASAPAWSPDSQQLAIVKQGPNGTGVIQVLQSDDLHPVRSFTAPSVPDNLVWSPDRRSLAFTLFVPDREEPSFLQRAVDAAEGELAKPDGAQWAAPVQLTQAARYRQDGGTWLKPGHTHLFVLSVDDGQVRQIGSGPFDDRDPSWMPDSKTLLFTSDRRPGSEHMSRIPSIYRTTLTGQAVQLTRGQDSCYIPSASPDGQWIAFTKMPFRRVNYTRNDLYLMHPDGTGAHRLAAPLDRDLSGPQWAADGQGVYAEYTDHGIARLGLFGLDGTSKEIVQGLGGAFSLSRKGDVAYADTSPARPDELVLQRVGGVPQSLLSLNEFLRQRDLGRLVHLVVRSSADGVPVEGWAVLPPGATGQKRLPTIVSMHGGPFGSDGPGWSSKFQLYAAAGYVVVYANYRGSTSYGASFSEPADHDFPGLAYDDMMSITDEAIRRGFADPDRLFVTGGSAGGQLTAWMTGRTHRFRAAVAEKPVINLLSDSLTTDQYLASPLVDEGDPWTREQALWAHSPLSLAGNMRTPMLFIVGDEDYRTPLDQTLQLYDALQLQAVPTALMRVPGAGHESLGSRPSQLAAEVASTLAWFLRYDSSPVR